MVDRLTKSLRKLSKKDRLVADQIISKLLDGNLSYLNIKKLRGATNVFRARQGRMRVIYRQQGKKIILLDIGLRSDTTYKKY